MVRPMTCEIDFEITLEHPDLDHAMRLALDRADDIRRNHRNGQLSFYRFTVHHTGMRIEGDGWPGNCSVHYIYTFTFTSDKE